jgi:hypothetical protein
MAGNVRKWRRILRRYVVTIGDGSNWIRILSNGGRDIERGDDVSEICFEDWR